MKISLSDINTYITCKLCNGYFRECHTIPECMHSFCKSCLIQYFYPPQANLSIQTASRKSVGPTSCPTCSVNLGQRPFNKIVFDRNIQAIVDKLFQKIPISADLSNTIDGDIKNVDKADSTNRDLQDSRDFNTEDSKVNDVNVIVSEMGNDVSINIHEMPHKRSRLSDLENDDRIFLKLKPKPNVSTELSISPLSKSMLRFKSSLKVERLLEEILKRLSDTEDKEIDIDSIELICGERSLERQDSINKLREMNCPSVLFQIDGLDSHYYLIFYSKKCRDDTTTDKDITLD